MLNRLLVLTILLFSFNKTPLLAQSILSIPMNLEFSELFISMKEQATTEYAFVSRYLLKAKGEKDYFVGLGLGFSRIVPRYNFDSYNILFPLISAEYLDWYTIGGLQNGYRLYSNGKFNLRTFIEYRFTGYDAGEDFSPEYSFLGEKRNSFYAGSSISYVLGPLLLSLSQSYDISNTTDGYLTKASVATGLPLWRVLNIFYYSYSIINESSANYSYGITENDPNGNINTYEINGNQGISKIAWAGVININKNIDSFIFLLLEKSPEDIENSPIFNYDNKNNILIYGLGANYVF